MPASVEANRTESFRVALPRFILTHETMPTYPWITTQARTPATLRSGSTIGTTPGEVTAVASALTLRDGVSSNVLHDLTRFVANYKAKDDVDRRGVSIRLGGTPTTIAAAAGNDPRTPRALRVSCSTPLVDVSSHGLTCGVVDVIAVDDCISRRLCLRAFCAALGRPVG